ncbi:MAG TPA: SRPBCC domain-containing protein [Candidatus Peribacteraceae bacterium]|nr:SRPBCC domain-containing protein [Candidatus Peribacteraceae bacterium]
MTAHNVDTDLVITRTFDAPVERVWEAWTQSDHIKKWWGPKDFTAPHVQIDFRVGGKYLYAMHGPKGSPFDMDMWSAGEFREIVPMQKIVATDHFADKDGNYISPNSVGMPGTWADEMIVTVTFEDMGNGKTKLTVVHQGHPTEMVENATMGWNQQLDKLAAIL